jgi:PLD-like domain
MFSILREHQIGTVLKEAIGLNSQISIAVPFWGWDSKLRLGIQNGKKIKIVCNLASFGCNPHAIKELHDCGVNVRTNPRLHAKIYCTSKFAIIGSSNVSSNGIIDFEGKIGSIEVNILSERIDFLSQIRSQFDEIWNHEETCIINKADISAAIDRYNRRPKALIEKMYPRQPTPSSKLKSAVSPNYKDLLEVEWHQYKKLVAEGLHHEFDVRLNLLRRCQHLFTKYDSFASLDENERKAIAGTIKQWDGFNWACFGSMSAAGEFANLVIANPETLATAIDSIPRHGAVSRHDYEKFSENFIIAFMGKSRTGGVPTASRLLAMKRPDVFLCVSKPNLSRLSSALSFKPSTINLTNYWEKVVLPISSAPWYNVDRPSGKSGVLWDNRAAMVDSICYAEI